MAIKHKAIIKEIIGPEAEQHGFCLGKNAASGAFKKMLASYEKKIDELYWQGFDIEHDSSQNDELVLRAEGINKRVEFDKNDQASFRNAITEFAQILHETGYSNFEEDEKKPRFLSSEHGYLLKNHRELANQFCCSHAIDRNMSFSDKLNYIVESVMALRDKEFDDVRDDLVNIAAFYISVLLETEGVNIVEYRGYDYYALVNGKRGTANALEDIFMLWYRGNDNAFVLNSFRVVGQ